MVLRKASSEWLKESDFIVIDPDGWDRSNYEYSFNIEKITKKEFDKRLMMSTVTKR